MIANSGLKAGVPGTQVSDEEGVLVVIAGAAQVGLAEDGDPYRAVGHAILGQMYHLQR
jgi:hypothetical protein